MTRICSSSDRASARSRASPGRADRGAGHRRAARPGACARSRIDCISPALRFVRIVSTSVLEPGLTRWRTPAQASAKLPARRRTSHAFRACPHEVDEDMPTPMRFSRRAVAASINVPLVRISVIILPHGPAQDAEDVGPMQRLAAFDVGSNDAVFFFLLRSVTLSSTFPRELRSPYAAGCPNRG